MVRRMLCRKMAVLTGLLSINSATASASCLQRPPDRPDWGKKDPVSLDKNSPALAPTSMKK